MLTKGDNPILIPIFNNFYQDLKRNLHTYFFVLIISFKNSFKIFMEARIIVFINSKIFENVKIKITKNK